MHACHLQHRARRGSHRGARHRRRQFAAHHQQRQVVLAGRGHGLIGHQPAAAQHGHAIGHRDHFIELVADEDHAHAVGNEVAQRGEQRLGLLRREHRGRLVEDQDAGAAVQRLQNLHALPFADRQAADLRLRIHAEAEALAEVEQALTRTAAIGAQPPQRLGADHHVVEHRQVIGQREVLVHHADAGGQRRLGVARRQRGAKGLDRAGIGAVVAEQDRHQRGLAGAVLAEQRQHLAGAERERDRIVGQQRAEALADAGQAQYRTGIGYGSGCGSRTRIGHDSRMPAASAGTRIAAGCGPRCGDAALPSGSGAQRAVDFGCESSTLTWNLPARIAASRSRTRLTMSAGMRFSNVPSGDSSEPLTPMWLHLP